MRTIAIALVSIIVTACGGEDPLPHYDYEVHLSPGVPEYGLIARGTSLAVVLAADIDMTLTGKGNFSISQELAHAGFSVASLDLPNHHPGEEPAGLDGWRKRIDDGETDLFTGFCNDLSAVLDDLHATRVSVVGISRGGYVAAVCAARDDRIQSIALLAPVTDLLRLREFNGAALNSTIYGLEQYVPILATRAAYVLIGLNDQRVGTDSAVAFAHSIGARLEVLRANGHVVKDHGGAARWVLAHR